MVSGILGGGVIIQEKSICKRKIKVYLENYPKKKREIAKKNSRRKSLKQNDESFVHIPPIYGLYNGCIGAIWGNIYDRTPRL